MRIPKVNCKQTDGYGGCNKLPRKFFGLFKARCTEVNDICSICIIKEIKKVRPDTPPSGQGLTK